MILFLEKKRTTLPLKYFVIDQIFLGGVQFYKPHSGLIIVRQVEVTHHLNRTCRIAQSRLRDDKWSLTSL